MQRAARAARRLLAQALERRKVWIIRLISPAPLRLQALMKGRGLARLPRCHLCHTPLGAGDQVRDKRGLRHVLPVFLRHFRLHRPDLHPCRIEDIGKIGAPEFVGLVFGDGAFSRLVRGLELLSVPGGRPLRRRNQPVHVRIPALEEAGCARHDEMFRLEPGDEPPAPALHGLDLAKPHESLHLVAIPTDILDQPRQLHDIRIRRHLQQIALALKAPKQAIEQRKAIRIRMADGRFCRFDEPLRHDDLR